ncbi:MAG: hypothetical protein Q9186_000764 [Xanthomendoza sp. 1 TL-2023]
MLPNPFSEEEAQRYINEFTTWPHDFTPHQIVYAGFRANPWPAFPDNVSCDTCGTEIWNWTANLDPLDEHLSYNNSCQHAIQIQAKAIAKEEAMKQIAIAKQNEAKLMEEQANKKDLALHDAFECDLRLRDISEARLLHFFHNSTEQSTWDGTKHSTWQLSNPHSKGMAVDMALGQTLTQGAKMTDTHDTKLLQAITEVVGEGGIMNGCDNWTIASRVNVLVVKKKVQEVQDNGFQSQSQATTSEWIIATPKSSVVGSSSTM